MPAEYLLQIRNLSKRLGGRKALDDVSLQVRAGEIVGLLGRNGAGKTTLLKTVIGLLSPTAGEIRFRGTRVNKLPVHRRARAGMGYLSQESSLSRSLTVEENILSVLENVPGADPARAGALLEEYGLSRVAFEKTATLSGGEMRRVEICRAMSIRPALLILDEPYAGVDPVAVGELKGMVRALAREGTAVLFADHNAAESLPGCDRAYILHEGRILAQGTPGDLSKD